MAANPRGAREMSQGPQDSDQEIRGIPCFVCGQPVPVRRTRKGKPFVRCTLCGVLAFVNAPTGIQRLGEIAKPIYRKEENREKEPGNG